MPELPGIAADPGEDLWVEMGEKIVRAWDRPQEEPGAKVLEWFTTEKTDLGPRTTTTRGEGFDRYREASVYDLLYVGIAKAGDSFDRLINRGHKPRMEILANEPQRYPGARVIDETYLFLFALDPLTITTFDFDHDFTAEDFSPEIEIKRDLPRSFQPAITEDFRTSAIRSRIRCLSPYRNAGLSIRRAKLIHANAFGGGRDYQFHPDGIRTLEIRSLGRLAQGVDAVLLLPGGRVGETRQLEHDP
jgi:hypothetical protein